LTVENKAARRVLVWDIPIRIVHWSLVVLLPLAWWTYEVDRMALHRIVGYGVLALMVFRLFWGFAGSYAARFANFLRGPCGVAAYLSGRTPHYVGHNPLGGWSVAVLLTVLCVQPLLGLFAADRDGLDSGPFAAFVSDDHAQNVEQLHAILFYVLLGLIALHILAIGFYALRGKNLVWPMLSGRAKSALKLTAPTRATMASTVIGLLLAVSVFASLWWWGG
jgi:cytochrome b